ncbi:hypothetical protein CAEBREN_21971 [Caenorhabditis brenneri]|uniref:Uncharacterized protein n=1 Tax=Caenorhabditis brenneri TaxID=135651 RepID=G0MA94_CAEBE|nr:hypothetical protein CAEBREN_21971 [Caenorhabditis brenneri]
MTPDTGPLSLYKLCFNSIMENAKSGRLDIEALDFSEDIGDQIMVYFNPMEIFAHAFHPKLVNWFYYNVFYTAHLKVYIQHDRTGYNISLANPDLKKSWLKWRLSSGISTPECLPVNIGPIVLLTKTHDFGRKSFTSYISDTVYMPIRIIGSICTLLKCDVYDMRLYASGHVYRTLKSQLLVRNCTRLALTNCRKVVNISDLIKERQARNMKTTLINPHFDRWHVLVMVLSKHTIVKNGFFNLRKITPSNLGLFIQQMTNRSLDIIELKVTNCCLETIENLKSQIGLKECTQELMASLERDFVSSELDHARRTEEHRKLFFFNEDGSVVGFYFYKAQHNFLLFFHTILCHGFTPKNENMG